MSHISFSPLTEQTASRCTAVCPYCQTHRRCVRQLQMYVSVVFAVGTGNVHQTCIQGKWRLCWSVKEDDPVCSCCRSDGPRRKWWWWWLYHWLLFGPPAGLTWSMNVVITQQLARDLSSSVNDFHRNSDMTYMILCLCNRLLLHSTWTAPVLIIFMPSFHIIAQFHANATCLTIWNDELEQQGWLTSTNNCPSRTHAYTCFGAEIIPKCLLVISASFSITKHMSTERSDK